MRKNPKSKKRNRTRRKGGGSIMVPKERTKKVEGDLVSDDRSYRDVKFSTDVEKQNRKTAEAYAERYAAEIAKNMDPVPSEKDQAIMRETLENAKMDRLMKEGREAYYARKREGKQEGSEVTNSEYGGMYDDVYEGETLVQMRKVLEGRITNKEEVKDIKDAFNNEFPKSALNTLKKDIKEARKGHQEGGMAEEPMAMPPEIMEEPTEDVPVDTYANATPEEIEAAQEPDDVMEEDYIEFVLNEALIPEEQQYLMNTLEGDPQLSQIFDKVVETASEFSGAGEVTGPGDGISDSIPARLSDGEFVMTQKATEQIGADNLQTMMDDAERAYDGGMMRKNRYLGGIMSRNEEELRLENGNSTDKDIRKMMTTQANKVPSLR